VAYLLMFGSISLPGLVLALILPVAVVSLYARRRRSALIA